MVIALFQSPEPILYPLHLHFYQIPVDYISLSMGFLFHSTNNGCLSILSPISRCPGYSNLIVLKSSSMNTPALVVSSFCVVLLVPLHFGISLEPTLWDFDRDYVKSVDHWHN